MTSADPNRKGAERSELLLRKIEEHLAEAVAQYWQDDSPLMLAEIEAARKLIEEKLADDDA